MVSQIKYIIRGVWQLTGGAGAFSTEMKILQSGETLYGTEKI